MVKIQWYPGHMEKARREMTEKLKAVDMIIEVRDARIPRASTNPMLNRMAQGKPRLIVLSKTDMADPVMTEKWVQALRSDTCGCLALDILNDSKCGRKIVQASLKLMEAKREKQRARGIKPRPVRAMAAGIPNVGKSTMINRIAGRKSAKTEDRPGVTRSLTWIHADPDLELLDTPGVLWPKFDDDMTGSLLAALGSINDDILDRKMVAMDAVRVIQELYPGLLEETYSSGEVNPNGMIKAICTARRLVLPGGEADTRRAADLFLHELRKGRLGRLTLEKPDEEGKEDLSE